ncbi:hypothetical protein [Flavobacterium silvaticum]|uniref:Uncharacterized protein n=1 Tax=Flavobacterium silvaticum TaxID=1852020 RepID=A0A972JH70_9FLAO|nr:hypothetical protein [Flavobacterium silvaticum]NMH28931.1 hypothetical protein [Flavobacterium silvaticum]
MNLRLYSSLFLLIPLLNFAQVGIGTVTPDASSALQIDSSNSGLLPPRVNLGSVTNAVVPINTPATGLLVYNTNAAVTGGSGAGYYFWNGSQWTKLSVGSDNYWEKNGSYLYPSTLSDNVGIGTTTPNAPLQFANTTVNRKIVMYEGGNNDNQYYGFGVNGQTLRYQTDNLGANHVFFAASSATSSNELMRIQGNGNVGIGTNNPTQKLDVSGKIRINDGTQAVGRVLSSDVNGVGTWVNNTAITPAQQGVFTGPGASFGTGTPSGSQTASYYCNAYITLPPGKWMVFGTYLLNGSTILANGASVFIRSTLSDSPTINSSSPDIVSGGLISGILSGPNEFGIANGQTVVNNTSGANKTYYMWANLTKYGTTPTTFNINGLGSSFWGENQLTAIPTN